MAHSLPIRFANATKHRIMIHRYDVTPDKASFEILGSRDAIYNVTMSKDGMQCSCPDYRYNRSTVDPCKHILYTIIRFFRITKTDLADMLSFRDIDWAFIQQHLVASKKACNDICPVCFDTFDADAEKRTAHMCQTCGKLTHLACHRASRRSCAFCERL